ncbi:MAG TPA: hypothetical protein VK982_12150 [Bacteroidales bacterium]|nr:hypothetical protein [Bacteroidales bacterium]
MKLRKIQAGIYEITENGKGIGRVGDKRKANLYDLNNLHWVINFYPTSNYSDHRLNKQSFRTLTEAKKKLGL